ncbi:unnamed protein product [Phytomonas sp. Hart1]|nr:unnamed protein product [Phytomonas sp. Hart1]|eukprot:CCW71026.1 unnamed protein product [Phytomonas sp. isolate Hart1]
MFAKFFKKDKKDKKKPDEKPSSVRHYEQTNDKRKDTSAIVPQEKITKDDFESFDLLGKGSFAYVVLCRHISTNQFYAMKVVNKQGLLDQKRIQDVFTERNVLMRMGHPYLLKLHWTFQSEHKVFFVMDYMSGGDLDKYMNSVPTKQLDLFTSKLYGAEILLVLNYLHDNSVIYRDLKPENILLTHDGHCTLADFGLSKDLFEDDQDDSNQDMRADSFVGSPFYVAPDVLRRREYTNAIDYWSFGILLYRMLCGRAPFNGKSMREVFEQILYSDLRFPSSVQLPTEAKDLISRLLVKDPNRRIKGPEIMAHEFWNGINFDDVMKKKIVPPKWTPLPTVEEMIAPKSGVNETQPNMSTQQLVNTPSHVSELNPTQQQLFGGFTCTAESYLNVA